MPRRTIRVSYKVKYRVQVQRRITYRQQAQVTPMAVPSPPPQRLTSSRSLTTTGSPIRDIRRNAVEYAEQAGLPADAEYELFILHASEDQADFVRPLANMLRDEGLSVWYSEFVMKPGMSLRRSIDAGLTKCEWGVVVLSPHFFNKPWPNYELDGLVTRSMVENKQLILPIWHNVGQADVMRYSPSLADKFALSTAKDSLADIARQIVEAVRDE